MTISKDIIYIGASDKDINLFEGQYVLKNGMSYNSYIIKDEKNVILDTIDEKVTDIAYKLEEKDFKDGYAILRKGKKIFCKLEK